jgi:hypothetical protein
VSPDRACPYLVNETWKPPTLSEIGSLDFWRS